MVVPIGFEPMAAGLENRCSIQLSYGTILSKLALVKLFFEIAKVKKEII